MQAGSGDIFSLADVLGDFSALRMSGGITRSSLAHLVDWRTTLVSLSARARLSELRGLAFVVGICRRAKRRTRAGGCCRGADRPGPVISPLKLRTPLKLSERNFKPAI
jgi:hypothetical protein